jgi:hypothetical protein
MTPPAPLTAYLAWAVIIAVGGLLALVDWLWSTRPLPGLLLVIGAVGGFVVTKVNPFDFVTGGSAGTVGWLNLVRRSDH